MGDGGGSGTQASRTGGANPFSFDDKLPAVPNCVTTHDNACAADLRSASHYFVRSASYYVCSANYFLCSASYYVRHTILWDKHDWWLWWLHWRCGWRIHWWQCNWRIWILRNHLLSLAYSSTVFILRRTAEHRHGLLTRAPIRPCFGVSDVWSSL